MAHDLVARVEGLPNLRLFIQPAMAILFAILDGRKDALAGRAPYFWAMFTDAAHRRELLGGGWRSAGKIFIIAIVLDAIYRYMVLRWFYPGEALVVAFLLAVVPYVLLRGPMTRILVEFRGNHSD